MKSTAVLALGTFAVGTDAFIVAGFLPAMASSLHVSTAAAGQSVTVFALSYAVLAPVVATVTARLPRRRLLVAALTVLFLANLGSALAPNLPILILTRVLAAAGAAGYTPNAGAAAAALVRQEQRGRALAVVVGGLTVATALGVPLGSLFGRLFDWRPVLAGVAMLCLLVAAGVHLVMPELPGNPRTPLRQRLAVLRRPGVFVVLPLTVIGMASCYTAYAYSVPALHASGMPLSAASTILFLYGVGAVLGNLTAGYATDRWGWAVVLGTAYVAMAATLAGLGRLAATHAAVPALVGLLALVWGASSWAQTPPQQHRLIAAAPGESPLVISLNSSGIYLGIALGTTLGGVTFHRGFPTMYAIGAAGAVLALLILLASARRTGR
ncbi:MFS transporter [Micromonospora rubida]|uniref:MFS transporter n=1 Tax=Micromonospora rubida TaxID=2697657 RepID=UPI001376A913|nr:MFS transporter [Micromonospora rubida]NBE83555.1 MFS transporter [Micromonospora rubida]